MAVLKPNPRKSFVPDDRQREAIEHGAGPMLVVAGAGTGKTSVLIHRIARLVEEGHAQPEEILTLTYTLNAAAEMRDRVRARLGTAVHAATFHDYCNGLLKRAGQGFGVLDDIDLWIYLRKRIRELRLEYFVRTANVSHFLSDLLEFARRCHDELVTPEQYSEYVARLERGELPVSRVASSREAAELSHEEILGRSREIARVFTMMERWLREDGLGTFSHMITRAHDLLATDEKLRAAELARARFILVDEFQDANFAQIKILASLAGQERNLFAVGDPDQAIYRFRGASSAAFELFHHHFGSAKLVVLGKNRRSTTPILRCAFSVIEKNPSPLAARRDGSGPYRRAPLQSSREEEAAAQGQPLLSVPVEQVSFAGKDAEASDIVAALQDLHRKMRCKWSDFGILYRQNSHRDEVVRELAEQGVPFSIESMDLSDTPEVRDLFACLGAVVTIADDASLFRVAALPQFSVRPEQLRSALRAIAKDSRDGRRVTLASVLDGVDGGRQVLESVAGARDEIAEKEAKGSHALHILACRFGLEGSPFVKDTLEFVRRWQVKATTKTGELSELLEYLDYFREANGSIPMASNENQDAVRLMTVHLAKGLEFNHVFILRATKPSFPSSFKETLVEFPPGLRDLDSAAEGEDRALHPQEERRLFYVAMTRARDTLHIYAKQGTGKKDKTPPGLVRELLQDSSLGSSLTSRLALGSQKTIFAAASPAYGPASRIQEWLDLPPVDGLHTRLSASAVESYERCPLQFKLEREWRISRDLPAAVRYGAAMHRVLKTYYDALKVERPKTEDELLTLFRDDLAEAGISDHYQHELYEKQGVAQLKDFLAAAGKVPAAEVLHTEEWFDLRVGETTVTGRIDRIDRLADGSVVVVDYKTGKARDQKSADESLQLSIYAWAAREKWGYHVDSLVFHNLEENVPVVTHRSEAQLVEARMRIAAAAAAISEKRFPHKEDFHCSFCSYRSLCPAKEKRIPSATPAKSGPPN
jgi:DNA helicase-2/ATP-dependent DNA helicase PcrA